MNSFLRPMLIKYLSIVFYLFPVIMISQEIYSDRALTGRGELELKGNAYKLQQEVYAAFNNMRQAAMKEDITIAVVSGYRSFDHQMAIWNRKYKEYVNQGNTPISAIKKIIAYSTLPGTSRHHWGTDIDIIDTSVKAPKNLLIERNYEDNGCYARLKTWMDKHAKEFGFYLVYTSNSDRKGFKYEPWHYSYKAISKAMLTEFLRLDLSNFFESVDMEGKQAMPDNFIEMYLEENLLDINPELK